MLPSQANITGTAILSVPIIDQRNILSAIPAKALDKRIFFASPTVKRLIPMENILKFDFLWRICSAIVLY